MLLASWTKLKLAVVAGGHVYIDGGEILVGGGPFDMSAKIFDPAREGDHIAGMLFSYFLFKSGSPFF